MKKILQICLILACVPTAAISQIVNFSGTVTVGSEVAANSLVSLISYSGPVLPADTLAFTYTNEEGYYEFELTPNNPLVDSAYVAAEVCPFSFEPILLSTVDGTTVNISCDGGNVVTPVLYIGGVPMDENSTQWYFMTNFSAIAESYSWEIEGQTYTSANVFHTFQTEGYHEVHLSVITASGDSYSASTYVMAGSSVYCTALFFPVVDSIADNVLYFINSSVGENLEYLWNFGDGTSSNDPYPTHTFGDQDSIYHVCLFVSSANCADSICMEVGTLLDPSGSGIMVNGDTQVQGNLSKSGTFEFIVVAPEVVLSANSREVDFEMNLFPNPTTGDVNLQLDLPYQDNGKIIITDISGKVVFERNQSAGGSNGLINLNVSSLANGIYLVQYQGKLNSSVRKMVLQR